MLFQKEQNANSVIIQDYRPGSIKISNRRYEETILVSENRISPFASSQFSELNSDELLAQLPEKTEVVIIGAGEKHQMLPPGIIKQFNDKGLAIESMATRPACHTFQVLIHEMRRVVALLYP